MRIMLIIRIDDRCNNIIKSHFMLLERRMRSIWTISIFYFGRETIIKQSMAK